MQTSRILILIVLLQALILLSVWSGNSILAPARAQIPDAGGQQKEIIDQLKSINNTLGRIQGTLDSGKLQVRAAKPDEDK